MGLLTQSRARFIAISALPAALVAAGPATAARAPISGELTKSGFTVIALDRDGDAEVVSADDGSFELVPPAKKVTLHLRRPNGRYAGPVVIDRFKRGKRAVLGVKAGAQLGTVKVRRGFARLVEPLADDSVDRRAVARARRGVPIGARKFGRVRVRALRPANVADPDRDGVPNILDIDDDGDLVLDNVDRSTAARAAQQTDPIGLHSSLGLGLYPPPNANAPGADDVYLNTALESQGRLIIGLVSGGTVELDCAGDPTETPPRLGLNYCSLGGSGTVVSGPDPAQYPEFPECCDDDGDGFGTLTRSPFAAGNQFFLAHGANSTQIKTGDVMVERVGTSTYPATLQYVFGTVPGLQSYTDAATPPNSATVYPAAAGNPGTLGNGFPVRGSGADGSGDVVLTFTLWRPQRRPIAGETGNWIDIGLLLYMASTGGPVTGGHPPFMCPPGVTDTASDQPANPANTITYTLNATQCLASQGLSWPVGEEVAFGLAAQQNSGVPDMAGLAVSFERQ